MAPSLVRVVAAPLLLLAALAISACGGGGLAGSLRDAGVGSTPDEFMVLPTKPLELPENLGSLPPPTPGARNRVDFEPRAEAVASLTGAQPRAVGADGRELVVRAGPSAPQIRAQVLVEDIEYRQNNRGFLFERWFSRDQEAVIYQNMILDAPEEFERARSRGVRVPAPPPSVLDPS